MMNDLEKVMNKDIPELMNCLPSEHDSADTIAAKMATNNLENVPLGGGKMSKFGYQSQSPKAQSSHNPFGVGEDDANFWSLQD